MDELEDAHYQQEMTPAERCTFLLDHLPSQQQKEAGSFSPLFPPSVARRLLRGLLNPTGESSGAWHGTENCVGGLKSYSVFP